MKIKLSTGFLLLLLACQPSQTNDRILFSSNRSGNSDIYMMNGLGEELVQLTNSSEEEWSPVWLDPENISFLRQAGDEIFRVKLDITSGEEIKLSHPNECVLDDKNTVVSAKGDELYVCKGEIYLRNASGSLKHLTPETKGAANYPFISPDGGLICWTSNHEGNNEVYILNTDTDEVINISTNEANDERGAVSPDGELVVFSSNRGGSPTQNLWLYNLESGITIQLTNSTGNELIATWSNNNETLFYGSNLDGNWEIYSLNIIGKESVRLTNNEAFDGDPRVLYHN